MENRSTWTVFLHPDLLLRFLGGLPTPPTTDPWILFSVGTKLTRGGNERTDHLNKPKKPGIVLPLDRLGKPRQWKRGINVETYRYLGPLRHWTFEPWILDRCSNFPAPTSNVDIPSPSRNPLQQTRNTIKNLQNATANAKRKTPPLGPTPPVRFQHIKSWEKVNSASLPLHSATSRLIITNAHLCPPTQRTTATQSTVPSLVRVK
jgi:hypothetical protein